MRVTAFLDIPGQDNLPPLTRLEKYAFSDNVFDRQIIARGLLDIFRDFGNDEEDFLTVMAIVVRLSEDAEPTVRTELMEQIPPIAIFLQENRSNFSKVFSEYLIPIVVRYLTDRNNQVRKSSQEALLILLEQDLIFQHDIENKVCPILLALSAPDSDDECKAEAVNIICKLASVLSKSTVERLLLPRFCDLCGDGKLFQVRKVCATNFGDICHAVGQEATEKFLIPKFFELCSDNVWGMRKACAECFMAVSYNTSPEVRRAQLSPLFIRLVSDSCRWVRQAAFQSLGPFISTFANPSRAGLYIREDGTLSIRSSAQSGGSSFMCRSAGARNCVDATSACSTQPGQIEPHPPMGGPSGGTSGFLHVKSSCDGPMENPMEDSGLTGAEVTSAFSKLPHINNLPISSHPAPDPWACPGRPEDAFGNFLYWRTPLPDISQDLELLLSAAGPQEEGRCRSEPVCGSYVARSEIQKVLDSLQKHMMNDPDVQAQVQVLSAALRAAQLDSVSEPEHPLADSLSAVSLSDPRPASDSWLAPSASSLQSEPSVARILPSTIPGEPCPGTRDHLGTQQRHDPVPLEENKSKLQDIIPQPLLDEYVSMTDPARAQTVDSDIAKHCAYSLPGVALTLGRQNWHCLKDTYATLASDVKWKVRRTLAFSIHELAVILGDQLTAADLVPIFNGFLKDLDEVRIGVLKHLYDFLKLLHEDKRREYLYQLQEFVVTDNSRNWRFRYELAEQLILILELYNPSEVYDYLVHIALKLCADKVSEVRWISFRLVVAILQKFYSNSESALGVNFISELILRFRHCSKWVGRQAFAFICQAVVSEECIPVDQFVEHLLPSLLSLASDPVPNVRVLLAKALRQTLLDKAYFRNAGHPHLEIVEETILALQSDRDQDVSFFATLEPKRGNLVDTTMLEKRN
ncbi:PREDICTED: serine/threonine-protein phosphatase 4 regulatory subunit 1 isoform X1 [Myotis brandtii]|nr:PREDICTED: serine/threonine-protein phosphatase 4 regulatory subunit 1 isoform X1 [Myotis brandtii]XP_005880834.1 PREDICTED: serine/threonine-protein phosphatase 4 regulatory subunit 1 isoform X1 [Myotis brandtii]XP_014384296.1 PREDICTED: serine/threonine-protein phosphatase 4 regulatory subunit 1 isoform X1 [Myotis brandtii]XP_014384297.1 PREDICTED: serine/threonine-protein phosphatase 4 regulatory subunit 1 isoform X1 [Myotis brandtii]